MSQLTGRLRRGRGAEYVKVDEGVVVVVIVVVATPRTRSLLRQCQYLLPVAVVAHSNAFACRCVCVRGNTVYVCEVTLCVCEVTLCMCVCVFPFVVRPSRLFHPHFILVISAMFQNSVSRKFAA